jgi:hypothetical protein
MSNEDELVTRLNYWKERTAKTEKTLKGYSETLKCLQMNAMRAEVELENWKQRAIRAEEKLNGLNE